MARVWTKCETFVEFRSDADVLVCFNIDASGPGSGCEVEWWFDDRELWEAEVTEAEEEAIIAKCIADFNEAAA